MASLDFDEIASQFYSKVQAYDFLDLEENEVDSLIGNWLRSAVSKPYIRRLFSSLILDSDMETVEYTMQYTIDGYADADFVLEILSLGLVIEWLTPKIWSLEHIAQRFGDKNEKFFSQAAHVNEMRALLNEAKAEQRRMIADRGYANNTYLDGLV